MSKSRLDAFSDDVIAILITIMVLELTAPAAAIPLAFVHESIALTIYVVVALMWLVPDRRIESRIAH